MHKLLANCIHTLFQLLWFLNFAAGVMVQINIEQINMPYKVSNLQVRRRQRESKNAKNTLVGKTTERDRG